MVLTNEDQLAVLQLSGELDLATAPELEQYLEAVTSVHSGDVELDLANLEFMDSTGLDVIVRAARQLRARRRDLVLRSPSPLVRTTLEVCGVRDAVTVHNARTS